MSNELMVRDFTQEDIELIKETVCKGATDTEFKLFINQARTTGLNPLARQVFAVKRWDSQARREVMSIQVSIDGFRLIAERTGKYAGQTPPQWCGDDGVWKDVWLSKEHPSAARVGVLRSDFKEPCWGVARFDGYAQRKKEGDLTMMWAKMGDVMIAKCAESLALRKAFPQELSGLYTSDEMSQATPEEKSPMAKWAETPPQITSDQLRTRGNAFVEHVEKMRSSTAVENLVAANSQLMKELKEILPSEYEAVIIRINRIQEAFMLAETDYYATKAAE